MTPRSIARLRRFLWRVRNLSSIMPWPSAVQLARLRPRAAEVGFRLRPLDRTVFVRPQTSDLYCINEVFLEKIYDFPYQIDPSVIVDVGANIGSATLFFAKKYPHAQIYAIEPERSNFDLLERNCAGLDNIVCIQAGVWPEKTALSFADDRAEKCMISLQPAETAEGAVTALAIPELMDRFDLKTIDILKLDIEGGERELFSNGAEEWIDCVDTIAIELHDSLKAGCARAFYGALQGREFTQEQRGGSIFVRLRQGGAPEGSSRLPAQPAAQFAPVEDAEKKGE